MVLSSFIQVLLLLFAFWIVYLLRAKATPSRAKLLTAVALILSGVAIVGVLMTALSRSVGQAQADGRYLILILLTYLVTSVITFLLYGYDKRAAQAKATDSRIREQHLHLLELLGGWPGAFLGVRRHRHKTDWKDKRRFKLTTWAIAIAHITVWLLLAIGVIG